MQNTIPYLSLAIWIPILSGLFIMTTGKDENASAVRGLSLVSAIVSFLVTLPLITQFDTSSSALQFVESANWIESINAKYALGVDGISVWFVLLTALITVFVVVAAWEVIEKKVAQYMAAFLMLSGAMIGVFSATDGLLF